MEKFAVDLEKVLDEFEFSEEREERVALSVINNQSLPYISHVAQTRPPVNNYRRPSFEPINLADADFAASPPRISHNHHHLQHNLTYSNGSVTSGIPVQPNKNDKKLVNIDKFHPAASDDRLFLNRLDISNNSSETLTNSNSVPVTAINSSTLSTSDVTSSCIVNTLSPPLSSRESVVSESWSEEDSSLSDEKPDPLDSIATSKSLIIDETLRHVCNDTQVELAVRSNDDNYSSSETLLPHFKTSTLPVKCETNQIDEGSVNNSDHSHNNNNAIVINLISSNNTNNNNFIYSSISNNIYTSDNEVETIPSRFDCEAISTLCAENEVKLQELKVESNELTFQKELEVERGELVKDSELVNEPVSTENQLTLISPSVDISEGKKVIPTEYDSIVTSVSNNRNRYIKEKGTSNQSVDDEKFDISLVNSVALSETSGVPDDNIDKKLWDVQENKYEDIDGSDKHGSLNENCSKVGSDQEDLSEEQPQLALPVSNQAVAFCLDNEGDYDSEDLARYLEELEKLEKSEEFKYLTSTGDECNAEDIKVELIPELSSPLQEEPIYESQESDLDKLVCVTSKYSEENHFENISNEIKVIRDESFNDSVNNISVIVTELVEEKLHRGGISKSLNVVESVKSESSVEIDEICDNVDDDSVNRLNSFMKNSGDNYFRGNDYSCKISESNNKLNSCIESSVVVGTKTESSTDKHIVNDLESHDNGVIDLCSSKEEIIVNESENRANDAVICSLDNIKANEIESVTAMGNSVGKSFFPDDGDRSEVNTATNEEITRTTCMTDDDTVSGNKCEQHLSSDQLQSSLEFHSSIEGNTLERVEGNEVSRVLRPNYLELPTKITVGPEDNNDEAASTSTSTSPSSATTITSADGVEIGNSDGSPVSYCDMSSEESQLGKVPPFWVPDSDALTCMQCQQRFTLVKRRHHCRACGQVLCSKCCCMRAKLVFTEGEAKVCVPCYNIIGRAISSEGGKSPLGRQPNPNNPMEYCSTIPPLQQAAGSLHQPPPSVLVPVGVLKREGRVKSEVAKQVMFSDGIRPGGDLTELDGSGEPRLSIRRPGRSIKRVGTPPGSAAGASGSMGWTRVLTAGSGRRALDPITQSFIPATETKNSGSLPPIVERVQGENVYSQFEVSFSKGVKVDDEKPIKFAINSNLFVLVKRVILDCCVNRECWCITSSGLACVGQDEVILVMECLPDETAPPRDVFLLLNTLYIDASKGNTVSELSFSPSFSQNLLDSKDHGGFLYIRPSYQCTSKLILPSPPYLVALLIHKWETPWARLFPIRLVLRLGAEYRYYPCPLVSIRHRQPLYTDIGHTIINILADFRKYTYSLPSVRGLVVHMEDRQTTILLPRNRYDQVIRALNNSNESVLAFGANLSLAADSHLVCIQSSNDESTYHTQAINIHNKPRKVTGASFVVFNGALKASCGLSGKSSIVEDGLMVQVPSDTMTALRTSLRDMRDYTIRCGPHAEETVLLRWTADDTNFNIGVKSCIDGRLLDGVPSMRVHNGTDYSGQFRIIRWTEVFILECEEVEGSGDPLDISRLSESLAKATCVALVPYLDLLATANLSTIGVRAAIHPDHVGYEAGSNYEKLPPLYMNSLDNELVVVVHQAAVKCQDTPCTLELVFRIMES